MYLAYKYMHKDSGKIYMKMVKVHEGCLIFFILFPNQYFLSYLSEH